MFFNDKKKVASVILSKMKGNGESSETEVASESGEHDEYTSLAEDILSAMKSGSVQSLASCLKSLCSMVKEEDETQDAGE